VGKKKKRKRTFLRLGDPTHGKSPIRREKKCPVLVRKGKAGDPRRPAPPFSISGPQRNVGHGYGEGKIRDLVADDRVKPPCGKKERM